MHRWWRPGTRNHGRRRGPTSFGGVPPSFPLRAASSLLLVLITAVGCSDVASRSPVAASYRDPAVIYNGAWYADYGVALSPLGVASIRVADTATVSVKAFGNGQVVRVRVDFRAASNAKIKDCKACIVTAVVAKRLSPAPHVISITNLDASRPLVVNGWEIDAGGTLRRLATVDRSVHGTFGVGDDVTFYVQDASSAAIDTTGQGASVQIRVDDRPLGYPVHATDAPLAGAGTARTTVAWGLSRGLEKIDIKVAAGTLRLRGIVAFQAGGLGTPRIVPTAEATRAPALAVYGDSIGDGQFTLGFGKNSDGFASQLSAMRGWRLEDLSVDGASGTCYGKANVGAVVAAHPDLVIVAFGANDMIPGADFQGCDATLSGFGPAMSSILSGLHEGLPGVPIYVQAILPSTKITELTRRAWNAVLRKVAAGESVPFVDPSSTLNLRYDYAGPFHPNNRGHAKIAAFWNAHLSPA